MYLLVIEINFLISLQILKWEVNTLDLNHQKVISVSKQPNPSMPLVSKSVALFIYAAQNHLKLNILTSLLKEKKKLLGLMKKSNKLMEDKNASSSKENLVER